MFALGLLADALFVHHLSLPLRPWVLGAVGSPPPSSLVTFASIVEEEKQQEAALIRSREKPLALIQVMFLVHVHFTLRALTLVYGWMQHPSGKQGCLRVVWPEYRPPFHPNIYLSVITFWVELV